MNKKPLLAVIGVVVLACLAGLGGTAWYMLRHRGGASARASRLPHDSFLVVTVDMAQARAWPTAVSLRNWLATPGADASQGAREAGQRYHDVMTSCGFDPWQKVDELTLGVDRAVLAGRSEADLSTYIDGSFSTEEARRCLTGMAAQNHRTITPGEVSHHAVLTYAREGTGGPRSQQFALLAHSVLVADQTYMPRALAVSDGAAPGLPADSSLTTMLGRLGAANLLNAVVDVAAVHTQNPQDVDHAVDGLVRDNPALPALGLLKQVQTGGLAVRVLNSAVTVTTRMDMADGSAAGSLATALNTLVQTRRGDLGTALDQAQSSLAMMQAATALGGSGVNLTHQFEQTNAGIAAVRQVFQQVHTATDGRTVVVTVDFTPQQVSTLDGAFRGMADILAEVARSMRGLPGGLGGMGGMGGLGGQGQGGLQPVPSPGMGGGVGIPGLGL